MNLKQLTAGQLMTENVLTVEPQAPLRRAARLLVEHHVHCLLVPTQEAGAGVGIITTKDVVQVMCDGAPSLLDRLLVRDVMTTPCISVQKDFSVHDCIKLMRISGVRSAPVLDGVQLVGLLSYTDVVKLAANDG
jgi:CBS domain-containing protein